MKMSANLSKRASRLASRAFVALCASLCLATAALGEKPAAARLDVTVQPEGAQVVVDGKPRGAAPCQIFDLAPGEHLIHVTAPSCKPVDEFVQVEPGGFVQKSYVLESEKGLVLIKTVPAGADVKYNGVSLGAT